MDFKSTVVVFLLVVVVVLTFATDSIDGFRKPPFNGSIFGKRTIAYPGKWGGGGGRVKVPGENYTRPVGRQRDRVRRPVGARALFIHAAAAADVSSVIVRRRAVGVRHGTTTVVRFRVTIHFRPINARSPFLCPQSTRIPERTFTPCARSRRTRARLGFRTWRRNEKSPPPDRSAPVT